jgi:hypothetical protein
MLTPPQGSVLWSIRLYASMRTAKEGVALEAMQILTKIKPDPTEPNEIWAKLRADPWQSILTLISTAVIVGFAIYQGDVGSGWVVCVLAGSAIATGLRVQFPFWVLLAQSGVTLVAASFAEGYAGMSLALAVMCLISTGIERPVRIVIPAVVMAQATFFGMFALVSDESFDGSILA